jgi:spermidine synthase
MPLNFEEIDVRQTPLGELVLRRRRVPGLPDRDIFEVKLNDDLLMSSLLFESEQELARRALPEVAGDAFDVLVGGLGLGYTAMAALEDERVSTVTVVEMLPEVIEWHERGRVPLGEALTADPRCRFLEGDFFRTVEDPAGHGLALPSGGYGAVLVDIDHAPDSWLHPDHEEFYDQAGLDGVAALLRPGGIFGFWSAGRPDADFSEALARSFPHVATHEIEVFNPLIHENQVDTVYVAKRP